MEFEFVFDFGMIFGSCAVASLIPLDVSCILPTMFYLFVDTWLHWVTEMKMIKINLITMAIILLRGFI